MAPSLEFPANPANHASEARVMLLLAFIPLGYCPPSSASAENSLKHTFYTLKKDTERRLDVAVIAERELDPER
jgi:hypothetical protein